MVTTGLFAAPASSSATATSARNVYGVVERHWLQPSITSYPRHMGVPMRIRTLKACAGLATAARRQWRDCDELLYRLIPLRNDCILNYLISNDIKCHYHYQMISILITGRGGSNLCNLSPKVPPHYVFSHTRRLETFFWGTPSDD